MTKDLYRRYLLWAYKTTRESFERIERKTTQLVVDTMIQKSLRRKTPSLKASSARQYAHLIKEFDGYVAAKRADEVKLKFIHADRQELQPSYLYLKNRLAAIEEAVKRLLGVSVLKQFCQLYEDEMTRRILEAKEPH